MATLTLDQQVHSVVAEASRLRQQEDDEATPYKSKYEAAELLKQLIDRITNSSSQADVSTASHHVPVLQAHHGLALIDTDLCVEAEASITTALPSLESTQFQHLELLQSLYNELAGLLSRRGELSEACKWLKKAEDLYSKYNSTDGTDAPASSKPDTDNQAVTHVSSPSAVTQPRCSETLYTITLFSLAQVYAHQGDKHQSALYCAATLHRQLEQEDYRLDEWVQNCLQLAGYYVTVYAFALATHCLLAAEAVTTRDKAASHDLSEEVTANLQIAWAKLYLHRLQASVEKCIEGQNLDMPYPDISHFPDHLRFQSLSLPAPDQHPWGTDALVSSFDAARELFNTAMPRFKAALAYYTIDGWVTEHCNLLMSMSNLYRCLAAFEPDAHRRCVMHKARAQLLEPLSGDLNPQHFLGLARSIDLELGNTYRVIAEIKEAADRPGSKVATSSTLACKYYQRFLDSFKENDRLPTLVDTDNEGYFLLAAFSLGRMMHKGLAASPRDATKLQEAHTHLTYVADYVKRNSVLQYKREADLAEEMAGLLAERLKLTTRLQASE